MPCTFIQKQSELFYIHLLICFFNFRPSPHLKS